MLPKLSHLSRKILILVIDFEKSYGTKFTNSQSHLHPKGNIQFSVVSLCSCTSLGTIIFSIFHLLIGKVSFRHGHRGGERLHVPGQSSKVMITKRDFIFHLSLLSVRVALLRRQVISI